MKALLQRVKNASVTVNNAKVTGINRGLLVMIGIRSGDGTGDIDYLLDKILNLRIFEDADGKFDLSVKESGGEILLVPQFTLYGNCAKGRRPDFTGAAPVEEARKTYAEVVKTFKANGLKVESGLFQARMEVSLVNDGPVTIMIESK